MCLSAIPVVPAAPEMQAHALQQQWQKDGYDYEMWSEYNDSVSMTPSSNGTFSCSWNNSHNCLFRAGKKWSNSPKWSSLNGIAVSYDVDYRPNGNSYLCIYGWTRNPLVEYYIVDSYGTWRPPGEGPNMRKVGNVSVDGASYEVYSGTHDGPSIDQGVTHFNQYWSVRDGGKKRSSGTIHVDQHFKAWEQYNMTMGGMYEVALNVEGWESSGQATVKQNELTLGGGEGTTDPDTPEETKEPKAATNGKYFESGFESGKDDWTGRGDATVSQDSKNYYSGSKSLYVSGRQDNWHGAAITLDPDYFVPGYTYSLSTAVLQKSGSPVDIKFTIQQGSGDSAEYHEVATETAKSGEWTKIENTSFTIPSGSSELVLYVEAPESLTDFYIDDVLAAVKGTKSSVTTGGGTVDSTTTTTPDPGTHSSDPVDTSDARLFQVFSKYFRFGTAVSTNEVNQHGDFILKHFNSITPENELKPDQIFDQAASASKGNNVNPQCKLPYGAKTILDFANKNGLAVRGHTLIWHSQTPTEMFRENFSSNGNFVSQEIMNQRIENWIKNVFTMLKDNYPNLKLYAYDVANECFKDGNPGGLRNGGTNANGGESHWMKIYNDDSFLVTAFTAAKKYAPAGCKLYYNDYNEYEDPKMTNIYNLVKKLYAKGILDGVGMQSHLDTGYPSTSMYAAALDKYASIGCDIQVTELDVTCSNTDTQGSYYESIVKSIRDCDSVSSLTVWGTNDGMSWRGSQNPLLFDRSYSAKPAFNKIVGLVPKSDWGTGYTGSDEKSDIKTPDPDPELKVTKYGDADVDGSVKMNDAVLVMQAISNADKYGEDGSESTKITAQGALNADVYEAGEGLTPKDALSIQKFLLGSVTLPESVSKKKVTDTTTTTAPKTVVTTTTQAINTDGYFNASFESGSKDGWSGRGDASVSNDTASYYDGKSSLKVSDRADYWNGVSINLDSSTFKAGNTYSFSAAVMQPTKSALDIKMTLQYNDGTEEKYAEVATVNAAGQKWTKLENTAYTIPKGATDLVLYIEIPESYTDFYVDAIVADKEGTKSKVTTGGGVVAEFKEEDIVIPTGDFPDPSKPIIALSFDDGASPSNNKRIVDALAKQGFTATFFYIGNNTQSADAKNEVKYAYSKGMEIANHTMSHPYLGQKSSSEIRQEVDGCHNLLKNILGVEPSKLLRLPYLDSSGAVTSTLTDYSLISAAINTYDYDKVPTSQIVNTIKQAMANGSGDGAIVLMHETEANTVAAVEELAPYIKAQGWQVATISQMYAAKGKTMPKGKVLTRVN
ncbi:MAG: endo-1,4-beta-xylanase [Ruminococcus sp.]|nr:endo-1,4-beta-xylanase [Ruminococcus sp.]